MKFRHSTAIIAIYVLFILLWMVLLINASEDESTNKIITQEIQEPNYLQSIKKEILSTIFKEYLTIRDILTFQKTCKDFHILLYPNDRNMVMFCNDFSSNTMDAVPLLWEDLKYLLNESYTNALENMEMLNLKINQYAILTRDKKIITWYNERGINRYSKMILTKMINEISELPTVEYKPPKLVYNGFKNACAEITNEGNVITYGNESFGGNSDHVQSQLKNVKMIVTTGGAFAALLGDGHVVAWGYPNGGDKIPNHIQMQLQNVKMLFSTHYAFAALLEDGSVVIWTNRVRNITGLQNIKKIFASEMAFIFLSYDGSVFTLGDMCYGEMMTSNLPIQTLLPKNVKMLVSTEDKFATLLENGKLYTWDREDHRYNEPKLIETQVKMIFSADSGFAALLEYGAVATWHCESFQYDKRNFVFGNNKVKTIFSSRYVFVALFHNGSVFAWGNQVFGGKIPDEIQTKLNENVKMIFSNDCAFVALLNNGKFVGWGDESCGAKITEEIATQLKNAKAIFSSSKAFAALLNNGSVFVWGHESYGGNIPHDIQIKLHENTKMIFPRNCGFTAFTKSGEMILLGQY